MPDPLLTSDDLALRPGGGVRSPWLREALAAEGDPPPLPGLAGDRSCDVAIVGGGYTGLWTALQLKERAPELEVVLLEQDICGGGPSGRNGGFVNAWWDELDTLQGCTAPSRRWPPRARCQSRYTGSGRGASSTTSMPTIAAPACWSSPPPRRTMTARSAPSR